MKIPGTDTNQFVFQDPRQERIYRRLLLLGPGPAAFYRDACWLIGSGPSFETKSHLVAHLYREIEGALRDVLETAEDRQKRDEIKKDDPDSPQAGHKASIRNVLKVLDIADDSPTALLWFRLAGRNSEFALASRAHRAGIQQPRLFDQDFVDFCREVDTLLDAVLSRFESNFIAYLKALDAIVTKTSALKSDVIEIKDHLPNNLVTLGYLFEHLASPIWLRPLHEAGLFRSPPPPQSSGDGFVWHPPWPQSHYLMRMAGLDPAIVLAIIKEVGETQNDRVRQDFLDAALAMPADIAVQVVPIAKMWVTTPYHSLIPLKAGALISHLAKNGHPAAALELASSLLTLSSHSRPTGITRPDGVPDMRHEPRALCREWDYSEVLKRHVPDLVSYAGESALRLLCDLLDVAMEYSGHTSPADYSSIWRPAIGDHPQNQDHTGTDVKAALVVAVRDAAVALVGAMPDRVVTVVGVLEGHRWLVFRRLALHVLWHMPNSPMDLVAARLADPALFDEPTVLHEYFLLSKKCFGGISTSAQERILGWIAEGPDERRGYNTEQCDYWRLRKLTPIAAELPDLWKARFDALVAHYGQAEHPDLASYTTAFWSGPQSPKSAEDLAAMSVEELVAYAKSWRPSGEIMAPSMEGLGRAITGVVSANPIRFAAEAGRFVGMDPTYVRALIEGLSGALKERRYFSWPAVIDLCQWAASQYWDTPRKEPFDDDIDPDWTWTRKAVARLLSSGFSAENGQIPFERRSDVWRTLYPITNDSEPTPEYEARYGGTNMDPFTMSINTARGEAMHAVVDYALWVKRHLDLLSEAENKPADGFATMPEVREVLDHHIDTYNDPSLAIRSVYGRYYPWLLTLDGDWAVEQAPRIFPVHEAFAAWLDAAWSAYIRFCPPFNNVLDVLVEWYRHAAARIHVPDPNPTQWHDAPGAKLAEHLMVFYLRGKLLLEEPTGLLREFYSNAPDKVCAFALRVIGEILRNEEADVPAAVIEKAQTLWEYRWNAISKSAEPSADHGEELASFGWWFGSARLSDDWALARMQEILKLIGRAEPEHFVVAHLAAIAQERPIESVDCLDIMIRSDKEGWGILGWRDEVRAILATALKVAQPEAQRNAAAVVNYLASIGHLEYRDLLEPKDQS